MACRRRDTSQILNGPNNCEAGDDRSYLNDNDHESETWKNCQPVTNNNNNGQAVKTNFKKHVKINSNQQRLLMLHSPDHFIVPAPRMRWLFYAMVEESDDPTTYYQYYCTYVHYLSHKKNVSGKPCVFILNCMCVVERHVAGLQDRYEGLRAGRSYVKGNTIIRAWRASMDI